MGTVAVAQREQWITSTGIAPPREHLELGDRVAYHHRACAARRMTAEYTRSPYWVPVGPGRRAVYLDDSYRDPLEGISTAGGKNKTVIVWPEEGSGVLIAMIRRGIGESVRRISGSYHEEPEPGYFAADEWVWLYAVKPTLSSLDFVLTPIWAT